ncbi:fluoride efflux transporter CrcB [Erythrobacter sp. W53]|uniref:fluoride efflux transporter CrcB n=1 Tax=Erythrobacteraceae TaxID=335929 RepID=UPI0036D37EDA
MSTLSPLAATLNVAIGGAFGAALRYQAGRAMTSYMGSQTVSVFPFPTLAVNTIGSLLIGLLAGWLARDAGSNDQLRLLLGVGLLGGFTTFSAFSLEVVMMIERGQYLFAGLYGILSVSLGITGFMVGLGIMRTLS